MNVGISGAHSPRTQPFTVGEVDLIETRVLAGLLRGWSLGQGGCTGTDEIAGRAGWRNGLHVVTFLPDPATIRNMAPNPEEWSHEVRHTGLDPLGRDRALVEWCDTLRAFALHEEDRSPRSGTWATIRMALAQDKLQSVVVLRPRTFVPVVMAPRDGRLVIVARLVAYA